MKRAALLFTAMVGMPSTASAGPKAAKACADAYVRGQELRNEHRFIEARDVLRACAQPICKDFIVSDCSAWLDLVQASLPTVVPVAVDEAGSALSGVKLSVDDRSVATEIDGRSFEIDPGLHTFRFLSSDGSTAEKQALIAEGYKDIRIVVVFGTAPRPPSRIAGDGAQESLPGPVRAPPVGQHESVIPSHWTFPWKPVGVVLAALGAVGLGAGTYFAIRATNEKNAAIAGGCNPQKQPDCSTMPDAARKWNAAGGDASVATVSFAVGGGLALSGILFWLLAPKAPRNARPVVTAASAGLEWTGTF